MYCYNNSGKIFKIHKHNFFWYFSVIPTTASLHSVNSTTLRKRKLMRFCGDFKEEDLETPQKRKLFCYTYQRTVQNNHKKIKLLKQKNLRLQLKVDTLNNLVDDLKIKNKISANCSYLFKVYRSYYTVRFMAILQLNIIYIIIIAVIKIRIYNINIAMFLNNFLIMKIQYR